MLFQVFFITEGYGVFSAICRGIHGQGKCVYTNQVSVGDFVFHLFNIEGAYEIQNYTNRRQ